MQAADRIASRLHQLGVRTVFTVGGTGSIYLDVALARHPGLATVCARHEAAATLMAVGAAKLTGQLGVVAVTSGPGGVNALSGLVDAWVDAVPVLVLSGQVESRDIDPNRRSFGVQGFDIVAMAERVTKMAVTLDHSDDVGCVLDRACRVATEGRPGPVWLDVPLDVQTSMVCSFPSRVKDVTAQATPPGLGRLADALLGTLADAERPLVVVGHGVRQANVAGEVISLVEALQVPVVTSRLGYDLLPYQHPCHMGLGGIRGRPHTSVVMAEADVVLVLGCSLAPSFAGSENEAFARDARVLVVDIDPSEVHNVSPRVDLGFCADLRSLVPILVKRIRTHAPTAPASWLARCQALKHRMGTAPDGSSGRIDLYDFLHQLDARTCEHHVFAVDTGSVFYAAGQALRFDCGQREVTSSGLVNMGAALPLAIGASFADPQSEVLAIIGDGALELNVQELSTLSQYQRPIKVFVVNNGGHASIRDSQATLCDGPPIPEPEPLDFCSASATFGLRFEVIATAEELGPQLDKVLSRSGPDLVEVVTRPDQALVRPTALGRAAARHDGATVIA